MQMLSFVVWFGMIFVGRAETERLLATLCLKCKLRNINCSFIMLALLYEIIITLAIA